MPPLRLFHWKPSSEKEGVKEVADKQQKMPPVALCKSLQREGSGESKASHVLI